MSHALDSLMGLNRRLTAEESRHVCADSTAGVSPASLYATRDGITGAARVKDGSRAIFYNGATGIFEVPAGNNLYAVTATNLAALRTLMPQLKPQKIGARASLGLGDRTGLATPGHIAAIQNSKLFPVLAQQSIREMTRTGRSAQQVIDDATFGVFEAGYDGGFGADADHLKTTEQVDATAAAGFTMFTIDPSAFVDDTVMSASEKDLAARVELMIADGVAGAADWKTKYLEKTFTAGTLTTRFDGLSLLRAAAKYGRAIAHAELMARHIQRAAPINELELSVDETALPTTAAEHYFVAQELQERGVQLASLAPRFIGEFEKGIDYIGDLTAFRESLREHAAIARHFGYKLSIHSGSDKFAIYPDIARETAGRFHVKTAGTSYLEALRVVARTDAGLFREIIQLCREKFETDRASYHISATLQTVPAQETLQDGDLEAVYLNENHGRQLMHVTFGSVLSSRFKPLVQEILTRQPALYSQVLQQHIGRHIAGLNVR